MEDEQPSRARVVFDRDAEWNVGAEVAREEPAPAPGAQRQENKGTPRRRVRSRSTPGRRPFVRARPDHRPQMGSMAEAGARERAPGPGPGPHGTWDPYDVLARPAKPAITLASLWDHLRIELASTDSGAAQDSKRELVENFLNIPATLEATLLFGWLVCLDSFLYCFTILPIRFAKAVVAIFTRQYTHHVKSSQKVDFFKGLLLLNAVIMLHNVDASRIYHSIRGQSTIKLYVLFNVLEIADRLCSAIGQDILDCLFSKSIFARVAESSRARMTLLAYYALSLVYLMIHATIIFYQAVTLNVTVNSHGNALLTLLMSNQVVEVKGAVFKKFDKENLFQITCADMVERFHIFIMLVIIMSRNLIEIVAGNSRLLSVSALGQLFTPVLVIIGSEMLVDWLKHAFVTKFNGIRASIYRKFVDVLCRDYVVSGNKSLHPFVDQSPAVARRIGLPVLPLVCVTIRALAQAFDMWQALQDTPLLEAASAVEAGARFSARIWHYCSSSVGVVFGVLSALLLALALLLVKLVLGVWISGFAHQRYANLIANGDTEESSWVMEKAKSQGPSQVQLDGSVRAYLNDKRDDLPKPARSRLPLWTIERFSMVSKRIW